MISIEDQKTMWKNMVCEPHIFFLMIDFYGQNEINKFFVQVMN